MSSRRLLLLTASAGAIMHAFMPAGAARAQTAGAVNAGSVSATGSATPASPTSTVLSHKARKEATQAVTSISKTQSNLFSPQASGLQSLTMAPGVTVAGYAAQNGSARTTLSVRGVKVGWNSVPGDLETNGLTAELDGVPLNSLIQSTGWHSTEVPLGLLLEGTNLIYGPGNPRERWYDSLGGTVNFIPVQPTKTAGVTVSTSFGSFASMTQSMIAQTGEYRRLVRRGRLRACAIRHLPPGPLRLAEPCEPGLRQGAQALRRRGVQRRVLLPAQR